ncbi:MAG: hypothetical protein A3H91_16725 [Gammaproteobacteria bacterium RIFCSPLOWO2_02_FULL_61_13]|nr:MAG: hypothetical protein A3H91_16725 [Gammaproteobacteria bacterium RIFCSPLOWO2_02_FULL_61_13]
MTQLTHRDLQRIRAAGGIALECSTSTDIRDELLRHIQATLDARSSVFFHFRDDSSSGKFYNGFSLGVPEEAPEIWCRDYQQVDPFVGHFLQHLKSGGERVVISSRVIRNRDYVRTAFYCDFLRPQSVHHVLVAGLVRNSEPIALMGLHRPQEAPPFESNDVLKMNLILPHLSAAVEKVGMMEKLGARQRIIDTLAQDLAGATVLMLDNDYRILVANESATTLLHLPRGDTATGARVVAEIRAGCAALRAKIGRCACSAPEHSLNFTVHIEGVATDGFIRAHDCAPDGLRFIVCFGPEGRRSLRSGQIIDEFGLSKREAEIVHLVSLGLTNQRIADKLNISVRTVENHLRSMYTKVKVHNRTSLLAQLARDQ